MTPRDWWKNCEVEQGIDPEIRGIDSLEDRINPVPENILKIRRLISTLEMCHHKAEKWVQNILEAISKGETNKGLGTRKPGQVHPTEVVSKYVCGALSAWVAGSPVTSIKLPIGNLPASQVLMSLGERTPIKEWQVQRIIDKIRNWTGWPWSDQDPGTPYHWLAVNQENCPEFYKEHEEFWRQTIETIPFRDLKGLEGDAFSLGLAIDLLWTCHWNFLENLQILLEVIGGKHRPERQFAACAWNIHLSPLRPRMEVLCNTLKIYCKEQVPDRKVDQDVLLMLGGLTNEKKWLALSLEKTIRLQLKL